MRYFFVIIIAALFLSACKKKKTDTPEPATQPLPQTEDVMLFATLYDPYGIPVASFSNLTGTLQDASGNTLATQAMPQGFCIFKSVAMGNRRFHVVKPGFGIATYESDAPKVYVTLYEKPTYEVTSFKVKDSTSGNTFLFRADFDVSGDVEWNRPCLLLMSRQRDMNPEDTATYLWANIYNANLGSTHRTALIYPANNFSQKFSGQKIYFAAKTCSGFYTKNNRQVYQNDLTGNVTFMDSVIVP